MLTWQPHRMSHANKHWCQQPAARLGVRQTAARHICMAQQDKKAKPSTQDLLTISKDDLAIRNERRSLINKLLPGSVAFFLLVDYASGGKLNNVEVGMPGGGPKGLDEARALKARSAAKSRENYQKMLKKE